jgi:hypothetical protein
VADEYYDPLRILWRKLRGDRYAPGAVESAEAVSAEAVAHEAVSDGHDPHGPTGR